MVDEMGEIRTIWTTKYNEHNGLVASTSGGQGMITKEQVEKAVTIIDELFWKQMAGSHAAMRAALESVESELLAQGMEKAAELCRSRGEYDPASAIRALAAKLREGKG